MSCRLLIVEDEETLRHSLKRVFEREGFQVDCAESGEEGLLLFAKHFYNVIISDIILPGMDGIELLRRIRDQNPSQIVIISTAFASLETAVKALKFGAYDYIIKPVIHEEIKRVVKNALQQESLQTQNRLLKMELGRRFDFSAIIGAETTLKPLVDELKMVVDSKASILLLGETGTGKGLLARMIHYNSSRKDEPFVSVNCAAIPENLIESELFGHVKGAFTGAAQAQLGLLHEADQGTVFLDEIGEMPLFMQVKLLKALEDGEIRPLGGSKVKNVDLRIVSATNRELTEQVDLKQFRKDLLYRLNVVTLTLPPLRERLVDLEAFCDYFLEKFAVDFGKKKQKISANSLQLMRQYAWPGNIRELQNVLERASLLAGSGEISPQFLPKNISHSDGFEREALDQMLSLESYAKAFIAHYQSQFNETDLAQMLGITRKTLWEKRKKWGLERISEGI